MLSYSVNSEEDDGLPLSLMTQPGTVQSCTLSYDGSRVVVNPGAEPKSFPWKTDDSVVWLVCSTGELLFTDVTISAAR